MPIPPTRSSRGRHGQSLWRVEQDQLEKLIGKWFLGTDRPAIPDNATYAQAAGSLFINGPGYSDVRQGSLGDCYFLSALGETAVRSPADITGMFIDNGDGTFAVRFYNSGQPEYVTVDGQLPVDGDGNLIYSDYLYPASSSTNELWVPLAEKAYAQLNAEGWTGQDGTNSFLGIEGGWPWDVTLQITGETTTPPLWHSLASATNVPAAVNDVVNAYNAGKFITLATGSTPITGIVGGHAYALVSYNPTTRIFTIFNPWGIDNPLESQYPGRLLLTAAQFGADFVLWGSD